MSSVLKKRRKKMRKHKFRKLRRKQKFLRRRIQG
ncbi:MAG: AURKAIP1/COX24 domain-containing protein [Nitrospiraceae bacterium]|jgi:mRNA-processing protein COX24|nr:AURKAIP1/COX24 domain-containing protein [Nitrospiraceae bacterium]